MNDVDIAMRAAEPMLASSLIAEAELDAVLERVVNGGENETPSGNEGLRVSSGIKSLDEMLGGGLKRGTIVGVSGELGGDAGDATGRDVGCLPFALIVNVCFL
jgi:hypothetical protein